MIRGGGWAERISWRRNLDSREKERETAGARHGGSRKVDHTE